MASLALAAAVNIARLQPLREILVPLLSSFTQNGFDQIRRRHDAFKRSIAAVDYRHWDARGLATSRPNQGLSPLPKSSKASCQGWSGLYNRSAAGHRRDRARGQHRPNCVALPGIPDKLRARLQNPPRQAGGIILELQPGHFGCGRHNRLHSTLRSMLRSAGANTRASDPATRIEDTSSIVSPPRAPPSRRRMAWAVRDRRFLGSSSFDAIAGRKLVELLDHD